MGEPAVSSGTGLSSWTDLAKRHEGRIALALLFLATIPMLTKIFTSDFGTHLALGRQILHDLHVADREFLNYPSLGMEQKNPVWLFQAVLYGVFSVGGEYAVSLLLWAIVLGIFYFLHRSCVLRGADPVLAVLAIFAFSGFLRIRVQPRPEMFTYLFISMTIFLFSEFFYGKRKRLIYAFPALLLVWANSHPTHLMAFLLCGAFTADWIARAAWNRELQTERLKKWVLLPAGVGILGFLVSGISPHGFDALLVPLQTISRGKTLGGAENQMLLSISELTPVKGTGMYIYYQAAALFVAVSLLLGVIGRRIYLLDLFLVSIAFKGAWDSARAVSMMGLFLSPGASLHVTGFMYRLWDRRKEIAPQKARESEGGKRKKGKKGKKQGDGRGGAEGDVSPARKGVSGRRFGRWIAGTALAGALLVFGSANLFFSFSQLEYGVGITTHKFSFAAADFLRRNPIPGKMFNFFDIGGFLDWQLYPGAMTFIDGRTYNQQVFMEHQVVTGAMSGWEDVFRKYDISYVVTKTMDSSGMILPLIPQLTNHPGWELVFADGLFVVFVRNTPENLEYIGKFRIPKSRIPQGIIWEAYHYMYLGVSPFVAYQTMSNMYEVMGNRQAAIESLRKALEYSDQPFLRARLMQLQTGEIPQRASPH